MIFALAALTALAGACAPVPPPRHAPAPLAALVIRIDDRPPITRSSFFEETRWERAKKAFTDALPRRMAAAGYSASTRGETFDVGLTLQANCAGGFRSHCDGSLVVSVAGRAIDKIPVAFLTDDEEEIAAELLDKLETSGALRAFAEAPPRREPAQAETPKSGARGAVVLKDGKRIEGEIVRQEPGKFVIVRTGDGSERTLTWDRIAEVQSDAER